LSLPLQAAAEGAKECPGKAKKECKKKCGALKEEIQTLQKKIEKLEKESSWSQDDIEDIGKRLDKAELHTATDKMSFGVNFRTEASSLHYDNIKRAPGSLVQGFFKPVPVKMTDIIPASMINLMPTEQQSQVNSMDFPTTSDGFQALNSMMPGLMMMPQAEINKMMGMFQERGFYGANLTQVKEMMDMYKNLNMVPPPDKYDANTDVIYTNQFKLDMKALVNNNLSFAGRLAASKVFGDSTGVKFNQGSLGDVTFDGTTSSQPHGDTIRMERAYFVYKQEYSNMPISFSLGRRPSTDGPPLEYGNYSLVAGSPVATIINWQFDGASLTFGLEDLTGIPGFSFKICYGVGFESDYGNSTTLNYSPSDIEDVHMLGFISDFYDDGNTSLMFNYAHAWDITDGFTGLTVMPFIVGKNNKGQYSFEPNSGAFITRMEPMTNLGDWDAATLLFRTNLSESIADIDFFLAGSWTHTDPTQISKIPFYEMMGMGLLSSGNLEERDGYGIYAGAVLPMPYKGRLGIEYNWGSKYWFNFTGAEDSLVGSKLAARGQVYEAYYIQPVVDSSMIIHIPEAAIH